MADSTDIYPFLEYILEPNKGERYKHAKDEGYYDPHDNFLIGESGGFLLNIRPGRFIDTHLFKEMADKYIKDKKYTNYRVDSIPHRQLRRRECERRRNGFTAPCWLNDKGQVEDIWITGSHYNFLNYTRMELTDESTVINTGKVSTAQKYYGFPNFIDAQYWTFQVMEFARKNGFHLIIDKTRRGGFSYIMASDSANVVNLRKHKIVIHVAADNKYIIQRGGLSDFAVNNLKFYEEKTPFKRGIYTPTIDKFALGYRMKNGVEADDSWGSSLLSVSANNNPDCAIGKDATDIKVEEVSTMDNLLEFMTVTEPTMTVGTRTTGCLMAWGTATSGNMQLFEEMFYSPLRFHFMPFENVWDKNSRNTICGFFKSYAWGLEGALNGVPAVDKDGNSDLVIGLQLAARERIAKKENSTSYAEYLNYLGQRALFPAESFSSAVENIFSSDILNHWEERLRIDTSFNFYVDGQLFDIDNRVVFKSNERIRREDKNAKVYDWIRNVPRHHDEDPHGCVRIWFMPEYEDEYVPNGGVKKVIKEGTYVAVYDPVGIDKEGKELTLKHSHNSIFVVQMPCSLNGFKIKLVAAYYGRPDTLEEADRIFLNLCKLYNCIGTGIVETNRGETVSNFKKWKALRYLAHEPLFVWDSTIKEKVASTYGYSITQANKPDGLRLLKEFFYQECGVDENGETIYNINRFYDYQTILELKKFNNLGNFDRVSSLILLGIYWKSVDIKNKRRLEQRVEMTEENDTSIMNRPWF